MSFFKNIFQSESPVSSRRLIAVWVAFVLVGFVVFKGVNEDNALSFVHAFLGFLLVLLGLTTYQNVQSLRKSSDSKNGTINPDPKDPPKDKPE